MITLRTQSLTHNLCYDYRKSLCYDHCIFNTIFISINDLKCLIDGVYVYAQFIFSFMWSEVAYAVNQTTRKKTTENRADRVFLISFVRPRGADLKFRKGLIWKKKQNCIHWAHMHQSSYSHIAVTSQESKKRGKAISCSHSWLSKLTPIDSSCRQHSESYFPWFI